MPSAVGKAENDGAFRGIGPQHLVKDRLQEDTKSVKDATTASRTTPSTHCSV